MKIFISFILLVFILACAHKDNFNQKCENYEPTLCLSGKAAVCSYGKDGCKKCTCPSFSFTEGRWVEDDNK